MMLRKEQWLEVGAMHIDEEQNYDTIQISALEIELLLPEAEARIEEKALIDNQYRDKCKKV